MDSRRPAPETGYGSLVARIARLELEERDAVRRRDWSAARSTVLERVALKESHRKALAREQGRPSQSSTAARLT